MFRLLPRIQEKISPEPMSGCWLWTGAVATNGYGRIEFWPKTLAAHRVVYETLVGKIPEGLQLDHLCRNRQCVNPQHLEPVTGRENTLRGNSISAINAGLTHCPLGHEYAGTNLIIEKSTGKRRCRKCRAK